MLENLAFFDEKSCENGLVKILKYVSFMYSRQEDKNGEYFIYTKGDANSNYDEYKITKDMIIGVVKFKIPLLGYPTVLLNEKW